MNTPERVESNHSNRRASAPTRALLALLGLLMVSGLSAGAASVTLLASDPLNTSSFTNGSWFYPTNWSDLAAPSAGNDYFIGSGRALRTPPHPVATNTSYTFAGNSLTLTSSLSLKGTNWIYVTNLVLVGGSVANGSSGFLQGGWYYSRFGGTMNVLTSGSINPGDTNRTIQFSSAISGSGSLNLVGLGLLSLSGAHTFSGPVTMTGQYVDMDGTTVMTPSALTVGKDASLVTVATGVTNSFGCTNIVRQGGNLNVGYGRGGDLRVGYRTNANINNNVIAALDVSSQSQFNVNVGNFIIGQNTTSTAAGSASAAGFVSLATNNNILATNIMIGDSAGGVAPLTSRLTLGRGSNYVDTPVIAVGVRKHSAVLALPAGGTLVLTNSISGRTDFLVCSNGTGTGSSPTSTADLSGGPFIASLGNLTIGLKNSGLGGGGTGTLTLATNSANAVDLNDVILGSMAGAPSGATVAVNGTLNFNGGSLKVNNNINLGLLDVAGYGTATGTLNQNGGTISVLGDIMTGFGTGTLNQNSGLLDLNPDAGAPGNVTVNTLVVNGTITNAGIIQVNTAMRGTGSIVSQSGATTVAGTLDPGTSTTAGTLNLGSLTLGSGATLRMNLTNNTTVGGGVNDLLNITGDLDLGNATLSVVPLTSAGLAVGTYRLANYTGEAINTLNVVSFGRYTLSISLDTTTSPKQLNLVVGGNPYSLRWTGLNQSAWDINTTQNWINQLSNPDYYFDADSVLFNDTSANPNITLDIPVQPGNVVFSNSVNAYSITGLGDITGLIGITKQGTGVLTIGTSNTFTGPVAISAGKVIAGSGGALGATNGAVTIAGGATLDVNDKTFNNKIIHVQGAGYDGLGAIVNNDPLNTANGDRTATRYVVLDGPTTFGGNTRWDIRGSGAAGSGYLQGTNLTLTKVGTNGVYVTDGTVATLGNVLVNEGSLVIETASTINPDAGISLGNSTTLSFYRLYNPMGRSVAVGDLAAIRATSSTTNTQDEVSGTVTLNGQGLLVPSGGVQMNLSGPVAGSGRLVHSGSGTTVLLNSGNNWLGGTTISNGTLSVGNGIVNGSLPATPAPINNYGTLMFNVATNSTVTPLWEITGPGGLAKRGDGILALTVSNSFSGPVNTGTGTPLAGGIIQFLNHAAFGDPSVSKTVSVIRAEVQLSGVAQIPPTVYLQTSSMSNSTYPGIGLVALRNVAGNTTISNTVELIGGAGSSEYSSDAGLLTLAGPIFLGNTSSRSAIFSGLGNGVVNGQLSDQGTNALTVEKNGPGTWTLTAANVYGGPTLVRAGKLVVEGSIGGSGVTNIGGTLGGTGTIYAPVLVQAAGTLAPGNSPGTLTINNNLTLQGTTVMEIGRNGGALTHDQATVGLTCFYGGTLVITNVGSSPLHPGDSFQVFAASARSGSFANIIYPDGYNWTNSLAADGRISVVSVIGPSNPPGFPPGAVATLPDGNISITATGAVGTAWSLRATNDLTAPAATWPVIQSGTIGSSPFTVEDLGATNYDKRFYLFSTP